MSDVWIVVVLAGASTVALQAVGPGVLGGRTLPPRLAGVVELLAPAVLAALVVTQAVGGERQLALDARLAGLAAAATALALRAPMLAVVVVAAVVTAAVRTV